MIKNTNSIVTQNISKMEWLLKEFAKEAVELEENGEFTINSIERLAGKTIKQLTKIVLSMSGSFLSNVVRGKIDRHCSCGKKMGLSKRNQETNILSMFGYISVKRDTFFCRRCHKGQGILDKDLEINGNHRVTKSMIEIITYMAQLVPSFERASEAIKKLLGIEVSSTQVQIISEQVGKKVFEKEKKIAQEAYEKPEKAAPQEVPRNQKDGRLYILTDGLQVNTRVEDYNGSTWKEMKLGMVFHDKDIIKRDNESGIITKKEYVSYFGSVEQFKKHLFAAAARAGYGKIKEVVIIGDGAKWIWNMTKELFPDAVQILDFYHLSENTHCYAKLIYPEDELSQKRWANKVLDTVKDGEIEKAIKIVKENKVNNIPNNAVNLYTYMVNNKKRINYKAFKDKGYIIGSGAIESANKMVIQQRMKQAGMRWGIDGGQYIGILRTKHESNLWDDVIEEINVA